MQSGESVGTMQVGVLARSAQQSMLRGAGIVVAGSALIALCAHISFPLYFTPVPVTLQPFAVLLLAMLLKPREAVATMVAYLAEGAMGLPVFTPQGLGGVAQLLGPTGGYLLSYLVVALLVSSLWRGAGRIGGRSFSSGLAIAGAGSLVTLGLGAAWLGVLTHAGPLTLLNHAVLPFLPADALKVAAAAAIGWKVSRVREQRKPAAQEVRY